MKKIALSTILIIILIFVAGFIVSALTKKDISSLLEECRLKETDVERNECVKELILSGDIDESLCYQPGVPSQQMCVDTFSNYRAKNCFTSEELDELKGCFKGIYGRFFIEDEQCRSVLDEIGNCYGKEIVKGRVSEDFCNNIIEPDVRFACSTAFEKNGIIYFLNRYWPYIVGIIVFLAYVLLSIQSIKRRRLGGEEKGQSSLEYLILIGSGMAVAVVVIFILISIVNSATDTTEEQFNLFWQTITQYTISEDCTPDWQCTEWSECVNGQQARTCTDENDCQADKEEMQSCGGVSSEGVVVGIADWGGVGGENYQEFKDLDFGMIKGEFTWGDIEKVEGQYDWSVPDEIFDKARNANIPVFFEVYGTPTWAVDTQYWEIDNKHLNLNPGEYPDCNDRLEWCEQNLVECYNQGINSICPIIARCNWGYDSDCFPEELEEFGNFMEVMVNRYKPYGEYSAGAYGVEYWAPWIELDIRFSTGEARPMFREMFRDTSTKIKSAYSDAKVVAHFESPWINKNGIPRRSLEEWYNQGMKDYFDVLLVQTYCCQGGLNSDDGTTWIGQGFDPARNDYLEYASDFLIRVMGENGDIDKPIMTWATYAGDAYTGPINILTANAENFKNPQIKFNFISDLPQEPRINGPKWYWNHGIVNKETGEERPPTNDEAYCYDYENIGTIHYGYEEGQDPDYRASCIDEHTEWDPPCCFGDNPPTEELPWYSARYSYDEFKQALSVQAKQIQGLNFDSFSEQGTGDNKVLIYAFINPTTNSKTYQVRSYENDLTNVQISIGTQEATLTRIDGSTETLTATSGKITIPLLTKEPLFIKEVSSVISCGNGICEAGETCSNCPEDCGSCPVVSGESHFGTGPITRLSDIFKNTRIEFYDPQGYKQNKGTEEWMEYCVEFCNTNCNVSQGEEIYCDFSNRDEIENYFADRTPAGYAEFENPIATIGVGDYNPNESIFATYPEGHEDEYLDFVHVLVSNYGISNSNGGKIKYWTIQNEVENEDFWNGTMEDYSMLVNLTARKIKEICPDCKVGIGLSGLYSPYDKPELINPLEDSCDSFDFIDAHLYPIEWSELNQFRDHINSWNNWFNEHGCAGKEFISLETGIFGENATQEAAEIGGAQEKQAQDAVKVSTISLYSGYSKLLWVPCDDGTDSPWGPMWYFNGMLTVGCGNEKQEYYSLKNLIEKVDSYEQISKLDEGQYKFTFTDKNPVYVLWCDSGSCSIHSEITGTVNVTDYLGNEETKETSQIVLTESLVFVEGVSGECTPNWQCTAWSECVNGQQTRTCTDENECGTDEGKPTEQKSCGVTPTGEAHFGWFWHSSFEGQELQLTNDLDLSRRRIHELGSFDVKFTIKDETLLNVCKDEPSCPNDKCYMGSKITDYECAKKLRLGIDKNHYRNYANNGITLAWTLDGSMFDFRNDNYSNCPYGPYGKIYYYMCSPMIPEHTLGECRTGYSGDTVCTTKEKFESYLSFLLTFYDGDCDFNDDGDCNDADWLEDGTMMPKIDKVILFNEWGEDFTEEFLQEVNTFMGYLKQKIHERCADCKVGVGFSDITAGQTKQESTIPYEQTAAYNNIKDAFQSPSGECPYIDFFDPHTIYPETMFKTTQLNEMENQVIVFSNICPEDFLISTESSNGVVMTTEEGDMHAKGLMKMYIIFFYGGLAEIYHREIGISHEYEGWGDGLYWPDGTKKPAYYSLKTMSEKLEGFTSVSKLAVGQYKFIFPDKNPVYVLWCDSGSCSIHSEITGTVNVTDYLGNEETKETSQIVLTESPVFVEEA